MAATFQWHTIFHENHHMITTKVNSTNTSSCVNFILLQSSCTLLHTPETTESLETNCDFLNRVVAQKENMMSQIIIR